MNEDALSSLAGGQQLYKQNIIDHFRHPRNKGLLGEATHVYADKNPFCGDVIKVTLKVEDARIAEVGFSGNGCAISQAAMSMLSQRIRGMGVEEVRSMGQEDILGLLKIPIGPVRRKCALLGLRVTQRALEEKP